MSRVILSDRQRATPPVSQGARHAGLSGRGGLPGGGLDTFPGRYRTIAPGIETSLARFPGDAADGLIARDRWPWFPVETYVPPADGWVNWTAAGPAPLALNMRQMSYRSMSGNTESRYPVNPNNPMTGLHTSPPSGPGGTPQTIERYQTVPQMIGARINRLAPSQYAGQSFSQTTRLQAGGVR